MLHDFILYYEHVFLAYVPKDFIFCHLIIFALHNPQLQHLLNTARVYKVNNVNFKNQKYFKKQNNLRIDP